MCIKNFARNADRLSITFLAVNKLKANVCVQNTSYFRLVAVGIPVSVNPIRDSYSIYSLMSHTCKTSKKKTRTH